MRYAVILAGGSGTRLWPLSRRGRPKQLLPLPGLLPSSGGRSLLEAAWRRLDGLVEPRNRFVCAGEGERGLIQGALALRRGQFIGEPCGRDTLNALALCAAVIGRQDAEAVLAAFSADQLIQPQERLAEAVREGFRLVEQRPRTLLCFGVVPTRPATGYGYLELGEALQGRARAVRSFREKPEAAAAQSFFSAGRERYLWNAGLFLWKASTFLECVQRYEPDSHRGLRRVGEARGGRGRRKVLAEVYPTLKKISVDYAVLEPASREGFVQVAALPLDLEWLDVGSWLSYLQALPRDAQGNAAAAQRCLLESCRGSLAVSEDPRHLLALVGCEELIVVHTPLATLVCRKDQAEGLKQLAARVAERFGPEYC